MIYGRDSLLSMIHDNRLIITKAVSDAPDIDIDKLIGSDSIDLRIGNKGYKIMENFDYINTLAENIEDYFTEVTIPIDGYIIKPGETLIIGTAEKIHLCGDFVGEITGRTRYARMGLSVCTANKFQGYSDSVVCLQISNINNVPLKIFPYQKLAQLIIHEAEIPNEARGNFINEVEVKRPIVDKKELELSGFDREMQHIIEKQVPKNLKYTASNIHSEVKEKIKKNNLLMKIIAKISNSLVALLGVLIGIFCAIPEIPTTVIVAMAVSSVFLTIFAIILELIKDNNQLK